MKEILVMKADGEVEPFDVLKLEYSLRKSRAPEALIDKVTKHILGELKSGMTTAQIYNHAFSFLRTLEKPVALRYSLKRAIMDLGPSGFPFEQLVARIFKKRGYTIETDAMICGACAEHEIDIIAFNAEKLIMVEAKFHNSFGLSSDLKVALYIKARLDDLKQKKFTYGHLRDLDEGWLVTNTKFTTSAIKYAQCQNITLVGWNYPLHGSLHDMIESASLHPLTCLTTLSENQKKFLLTKNSIVCTDLRDNKNLLHEAGLSSVEVDAVYKEIDSLYV